MVGCQLPRRPLPTHAAPTHPARAEGERGLFSLAAGEAEVDGSATREVCRHRALGAGGKGCHTASRGPGEHPGAWGAEEERAQAAAPSP